MWGPLLAPSLLQMITFWKRGRKSHPALRVTLCRGCSPWQREVITRGVGILSTEGKEAVGSRERVMPCLWPRGPGGGQVQPAG